VLGPNSYQLTPNAVWNNGAIWYQLRHDLDDPFSVSGQLYFGTSDAGADGIVFVLQDNCLSAGTAGGGIGYQNMPGNSIGVEFDTYQNGAGSLNDPPEDHLALQRMGNVNHTSPNNLAGPFQIHATQANVEDGLWHDFEINYNPTNTVLEVYFDGSLRLSHTIDLKNTIFNGNPFVYWGFVSATGGLSAPHAVNINNAAFTIENDTICTGSTTVTLPPLTTQNVALNKVSNSSSNQSGGAGPPASNLAFDGLSSTRWSSAYADPQWISVDLGAPMDIDSVDLHWEAAYATEYKIQTSTNNVTWTDIFHETAGNGGYDHLSVSASGVRYVRMYGIQRGTSFGYSLWEFEVYSTPQYTWTPNNGTINDPNSATPIFTPTTTTTYTVEIPDPCIGASYFDYTVVVQSTVDPSFTPVGPLCVDDGPTPLTAVNPGNFMGAGITGATFDPSVGPGQYLIEHWYTDSTGCTDSSSQLVTVHGLPSVTLGADTTICADQTLTLNAGSGFQSYVWSTGSMDSAINIGTSGSYQVLVTDTNGCSASDTVSVAITPLPAFSLGPDTLLCEDELLVLDPGISGSSYWWNTGSNATSISVQNSPGWYALTLTENNCSYTDSVLVDYQWFPVVILPADTVVCTNTTAEITAEVYDQHSLVWQDGTTDGSYAASGDETVIATVQNQCATASDTMQVSALNCDCNVYLPNAFTPNYDGQNDFFSAVADCDLFLDFELRVYNRWGELVFTGDELNDAWDGTYQGALAADGVYVTHIRYTANINGAPVRKEKLGHVVLIR